MKEKEYQQCKRCVMDTSDCDITFDEKGYCNHCKGYFEKLEKQTYQGSSSDIKIKALVQKIKSRANNNNYDCVVGISGGVDSCYTAYILKKLGLKPLAVHLDNGWDSEAAVKNIKYVVSKLGIDYQSYVLDWEEFKDLQLAFLNASVPEAETPTDIAILAALHKVAAENNIKYVISGGNYVTEGILPKSWHYNAKDVKYLRSIYKKFGTGKLRTFPTFGFITELYYKYIKGIKIIYLLNYVNFNKRDAIALLEKELDWKYYGGKHYESKYTGFLQSYILPVKFNIDYRRATLSTQICAGEMTRENALLELSNTPYQFIKVGDEIEYLSKKLGISTKTFSDIMNLPPKSHKDYPNNEVLLEFIYKIYRKLTTK